MIFNFKQYTLDTERFQLRRQDQLIALEPLAFDLLVCLVENHERVVTRDELLEKLWAGKIVTDAALSARLKDARKALQDSGARQEFIRTVHGRGYQFVADVTPVSAQPAGEFAGNGIGDPVLVSPPDKPSIAVLPLTNLSNDPEQEYFGDGITEEIITALARFRNLLVIDSDSTAGYKGNSADTGEISREQGVRYVLEGSVRKSGNRVRVNVHLVDTDTSEHVWAERYDRELADIFAVQDDIMREIVIALNVQLSDGEQARAWSSGTASFEAWACVQQATFNAVHDMRPDTKSQARALLEKALELDPDYAIAWVMLGWIYQQYADVASLASDSRGTDSALASMLDCARRALAADPLCADAHCLMAMYHLEVKAFDEALGEAQQAIALAPGNANNLAEAGMIMNKTGNPRQAIELIRKAMRLCPNYRPGFLRGLGLAYYLLGQLDVSTGYFQESIARESEYLSAYTTLAAIQGEQGTTAEAARTAAEIMRLAPDFAIESYIACLSFRDPEVLQRMRTGLQKAGLH